MREELDEKVVITSTYGLNGIGIHVTNESIVISSPDYNEMFFTKHEALSLHRLLSLIIKNKEWDQ